MNLSFDNKLSYTDDKILDGNTSKHNTELPPEVMDTNENTDVITFPAIHVQGTPCRCDASTEVSYDDKTFQFLRSIAPMIITIASSKDVPAAAVAGAIADEFNSRFDYHGIRGIVDQLQDFVIDILPEFAIDVDRFFDFHNKLFNALENDIGPANVKVRTALQLVQREWLSVPGSPVSDEQVSNIVDFLLTERGTVEAAAAVIAMGKKLFGHYISDYSDGIAETILVEYYKQGDSFYNRFYDRYLRNPRHKPCPGYDGCQFLHNRERIFDALR
jgi:hypothetical protein